MPNVSSSARARKTARKQARLHGTPALTSAVTQPAAAAQPEVPVIPPAPILIAASTRNSQQTSSTAAWNDRPGATARIWPSEQVIRLVCRMFPQEARQGIALDVGCGNGRNAIALASLGFGPVLATDACESLVAATAERATTQGWPIEAQMAELPVLPHDTASARLALAWGVLFVLKDRATILAAMRELLRVLQPGGVLIADWRSDTDSLRQFAGERRDDVTWVLKPEAPLNMGGATYSFWSRSALDTLYALAGFDIVDMQRQELYELKTDQTYSWWQVCARKP